MLYESVPLCCFAWRTSRTGAFSRPEDVAYFVQSPTNWSGHSKAEPCEPSQAKHAEAGLLSAGKPSGRRLVSLEANKGSDALQGGGRHAWHHRFCSLDMLRFTASATARFRGSTGYGVSHPSPTEARHETSRTSISGDAVGTDAAGLHRGPDVELSIWVLYEVQQLHCHPDCQV